MIFKRGFLLILIRVILIVLFTLGLIYSHLETDLAITPYMFGAFIIIIVLELTWRLQSQERNWVQFLQSVKYGDFNRAYQYKTSSKELQQAYELITDGMEQLQTNRQAEIRLLQTVLKHVSVAVVCFKETGELVFTNQAFNMLLDKGSMINIESMRNTHPTIYNSIIADQPSTSAWIDHKNGQKLLVKTEIFKLKGETHRLCSLSDIKNSLEVKELESYQKLMRVMTHEIMNSTSPILSLIKVINQKLVNNEALNHLSEKDQRNVAKSLEAIEERADGMLKFVKAYKQINKPIQPNIKPMSSSDLLAILEPLIEVKKSLNFKIKDNYQGQIHIDSALMIQVLINLINNAQDALAGKNHAQIELYISRSEEHLEITISDNGPGVEERLIQEIFVPFFTTKINGSGIGLALSRKIIKAHQGSLDYQRRDNTSNFVITLPLS